jgi:hypothetical protein
MHSSVFAVSLLSPAAVSVQTAVPAVHYILLPADKMTDIL